MELSIKKLGNSAGIILPPALMRALNITVGSAVKAEEVKGALVLTPAVKQRYSLHELLAKCDPKAPVPEDLKAWNEVSPVGKEFA